MNPRRSFAIVVSLMCALGGCNRFSSVRSQSAHTQDSHIDDLVLIEFAARLEDDYHKLHPEASRFYNPPHSTVQVPATDVTPSNSIANPVEPNAP